MEMWRRWQNVIKKLKRDVLALYLVVRDPRTPRWIKGLAVVIVGYALSPIDLIPDMIPILGQLDDLILLPLMIALLIRVIPPDVLDDCRVEAESISQAERPVSYIAGVIIVGLWVLIGGWVIYLII